MREMKRVGASPTGTVVSSCFLLGVSVACLRAEDSGTEEQGRKTPVSDVLYTGHQSDCSLETLARNRYTELDDYQLHLDYGWGQGVEIYLAQSDNPSSVVCNHPRRRLSQFGNFTQRAVVTKDGKNTFSQVQLNNGVNIQQQAKFIDRDNRRFIAFEEQEGACEPYENGQNTAQSGCIVWGLVRNDRRVQLIDGSCLGSYRISGVSSQASREILFPETGIRDFRGAPVEQCYILTTTQTEFPQVYDGPWNDRPDFNPPGWPPDRWEPEPLPPPEEERNVVAEILIDAGFNILQYKLCRDASPRNFKWMSALSCRLSGFSPGFQGFERCLYYCRAAFAEKQWRLGNPDYQDYSPLDDYEPGDWEIPL